MSPLRRLSRFVAPFTFLIGEDWILIAAKPDNVLLVKTLRRVLESVFECLVPGDVS